MFQSEKEQNINPLKTELLIFTNAVMFLTRLPVPQMEYRPFLEGKSASYFPLVGLLVGVIGGAVFSLASLVWPAGIAIAMAMIATVLCTGAFHEDGLADSADGIGGGWSVEDKLRIMKDSAIGTYGALALILSVLLKFRVLTAIPEQHIPAALIIGHVLGRWSTLPLLRYGRYIGGGSGNPFVGATTDGRMFAGTLLAALLVTFVAPAGAIAALMTAVLLTAASLWYFRRALGGVTGDSLGAANQFIEISMYLVIAANLTH
jgi:adenosylcobinamide-GDP ribazoletransferase